MRKQSSPSSNGSNSSSANDGDKIRQLQRLLLGVTKAIQTYLLEDIATVMESIHDMDDVKRYLSVVKCIARVNQHLADLPVPDAFAYEEPPFAAGGEEFVSFQRRMHYALWLIHAKLHVLPPFIASTDGPAQLVALAKALKIAKAELQTFAVQLSELNDDMLSEPNGANGTTIDAAGNGGDSNRQTDGSDDDDDDEPRQQRRAVVVGSPESSSSDLDDEDDEEDDDGKRVVSDALPIDDHKKTPPPPDHLARRSSSSDDLFHPKVRSTDASSSGEEAADDSRSGDIKKHLKIVSADDEEEDDEVATYMVTGDVADNTLSSSTSSSSSGSSTSSGSLSTSDDEDEDDEDDFQIEGGIEVVFVDDENAADNAIIVVEDVSPPLSATAASIAAPATASDTNASLSTTAAVAVAAAAAGAAVPVRSGSPRLRSPPLTTDADEDDHDDPGSDGELAADPSSDTSMLRRRKPKRTHRRSPSQLSSAHTAKVSPSTSDDGEALGGSRVARSRLSTSATAADDSSPTVANTVESVVLVRVATPPVVLDAAGDIDMAAAVLRNSTTSPAQIQSPHHSPRVAAVAPVGTSPPPSLPPTPPAPSPPAPQTTTDTTTTKHVAKHTRSFSSDTTGNADHNHRHADDAIAEKNSPGKAAMQHEITVLRARLLMYEHRVGELERNSNHYSASTRSSSSSSSASLSVSSNSSATSGTSSEDDDSGAEPPAAGSPSEKRNRRRRRRRQKKTKRMDTLDIMTPPEITPRNESSTAATMQATTTTSTSPLQSSSPPQVMISPSPVAMSIAVLPPTVVLRAPFG